VAAFRGLLAGAHVFGAFVIAWFFGVVALVGWFLFCWCVFGLSFAACTGCAIAFDAFNRAVATFGAHEFFAGDGIYLKVSVSLVPFLLAGFGSSTRFGVVA